jgi:hypothetical protein
MSTPNNQIASLWVNNAAKTLHAIVEIVGVRVWVRETGALVNRMHQV